MNSKEIAALFRRRFSLPKERPVQRTIRSLTLAERTVFFTFTGVFILSSLFMLLRVSEAFLASVPIEGGSLTEGVVGNPRFINPVLALSEADKNLTSLVYSGLIRVSARGEVINDLADSVEVNESGLRYVVTISEKARFHDDTPVGADDVVFTVSKIIDPLIKSPRRGNWDGVSVEKIDTRTVAFNLKKAYAPFIYNLSTGILPRHIWKNVSADEFSFSQFNTLPIGSGPYRVARVERNEGGIPDYYRLTPFDDAAGGAPFIRDLIFRFYPSEKALTEAYRGGSIEAIGGLTPEKFAELELKSANIVSSPLSRIFGVFFNQSQARIFLDKNVRLALSLAAPREEIIEEVFGGYAKAINGPLPAGLYEWTSETNEADSSQEERLARAALLLSEAGWKPNAETGILEKTSGSGSISLSFSISTGDAPELQKVAAKLEAGWQRLGADVKVLIFETGELNQNVIRPRNFDTLLFGEMIGRDADLYPFWHSSQRNDPGLNIALYANSKADRILEEVRSEKSCSQAEENHRALAAEIRDDVPAVFLYTPSYLYLLPEKVRAVELGFLSVTQDRFAGIRSWYTETDRVWKVFLD